MKKVILFAAILFAGVSVVKAEGPTITTNEDQVILNVKLNPIQTIIVNGEKEVNLVYKTIEDYQIGVTEKISDHLLIHSSGKFKVTFKSDNANLTGGTKNIEVGTISIGATGEGSQTALALSTVDQVLIQKDNGGAGLKFDVTYKGKGDYAYMDHYSSTADAVNVYTTNVLYTITTE